MFTYIGDKDAAHLIIDGLMNNILQGKFVQSFIQQSWPLPVEIVVKLGNVLHHRLIKFFHALFSIGIDSCNKRQVRLEGRKVLHPTRKKVLRPEQERFEVHPTSHVGLREDSVHGLVCRRVHFCCELFPVNAAVIEVAETIANALGKAVHERLGVVYYPLDLQSQIKSHHFYKRRNTLEASVAGVRVLHQMCMGQVTCRTCWFKATFTLGSIC